MGQLRLALLGPPEVWLGERRITLRTHKALALLAYLIAEEAARPRDQLGALLWPELDGVGARNNVRVSLFYLRHALGKPALTTFGDVVGCAPSTIEASDLHQLAQAERRARASGHAAGIRAELQAATALYRGPFLDGLVVPDAPDFETWLAGQRAHWHGVILAVLDRLATTRLEAGEAAGARTSLERLVALDPGVEDAWQRLLALDLDAGDILGARRAWTECRQAMADLGLAPGAALEAIASRLEVPGALHSAAAPDIGADAAGDVLADLPLVGRAQHSAVLHRLFERCQAGQFALGVLLGEAGVGKTRLAGEFLAWAREHGAETLAGRAFGPEGGVPYAPVVEALRPGLERENAPEDLLGDVWLAELARVLPELRERYPDLPATTPDLALEHARLLEAVARLGLALAARRPVVLFLDDAQWNDKGTRDIVRYTARQWSEAGARILLLLAIRADDLTRDPELPRWLGGLERESPITRVELGRLAPEDVAQLVDLLGGSDDGDAPEAGEGRSSAFGQWLAQQCDGNPAALVRTLRAMLATNQMSCRTREDGSRALELRATPPPLLPAPRRQSRLDWGDAPDTAGFFGRDRELAVLEQWLVADTCRLVSLIGIGGIGKTALAARLGRAVAAQFDAVVWRSLRNAPPVDEWLADMVSVLAARPGSLPVGVEARLALLLQVLREQRCLLVLDNLETVLAPGVCEGRYRDEYAGYGRVLQQIGELAHQSCLLLTSRELPAELTGQEDAHGPVRTLRLQGLDLEASRAMLHDQGLSGTEQAWQELVARFGGNALALKMASHTIRDLYIGDIPAFLHDLRGPSGAVFGGIRQLFGTQVERLSPLERDILYWLAIEREPVGFGKLTADLEPTSSHGDVLEALEALRRRSLIERGEHPGTFTLQPVILEYTANRLVEAASQEIQQRRPQVLLRHALLQATAKDYVRRSQARLIAGPLLERLVAADGSAAAVEQRLLGLLGSWRGQAFPDPGYGPGNVVNLLRLMRGDLRNLDLSRLAIRQAYLQEVDAQDSSLAGAHLTECALPDAFFYPTSVALDGNGTHLAAGTSHGELRVWRLSDRTPILAAQGHSNGVYGLALAAGGSLMAAGSVDGTVTLWDVSTGQLVRRLEAHGGPAWGVALSGDGQVIAAGIADGTVRVWEAMTGRTVHTLEGHSGPVWGVALSADGHMLASSSYDGTARLWELPSGALLATLRGHASGVRATALSADGRLVASGGYDGTVRLWEAAGGRLLATLQGHTGCVWGVALSADGRLLASSSYDGTVKLWEAPSGRLIATLQGHTGYVWGVALTLQGRLVASGSYDGTVRLWEAPGGQVLATLQGQIGGVSRLAISANGRRVARGGMDGVVKVWATAQGRLLATLQGHSGGIYGVAISADGRLVASGSRDGSIRLWEAASGRALATLQGHTGLVWGVALSADGRLLASGSFDGTVKLWDVASRRLLSTLHGHSGGIIDVALSADGRLVASGSDDGTITVWKVESGELAGTLQGHSGAVRGVALSGDGQLVASGGDDGLLTVWDIARERELTTVRAHSGGVLDVSLSSDGRLVASAGLDSVVKLWNASSGQPLATLRGHTGAVRAVALSADGRTVASGGTDGVVRLWDVAGATLLHALQGDRSYERLDITGLSGITPAQRAALIALGAREQVSSDGADPADGGGFDAPA